MMSNGSNGPISEAELRIFVDEVLLQSKFAAFAYNNMVTIIRQNTGARTLKDPTHPDTVRIHESFWFSIHSFTAAVGNLSKLLWPETDDAPHIPNRGDALRDTLKVTDDSPLKDPGLRHHLDQIDQRLEVWARSYASSNPIEMDIGSRTTPNGSSPANYLRNYEYDVPALTFQGEVYEIGPIIEAVQELLDQEVPPDQD